MMSMEPGRDLGCQETGCAPDKPRLAKATVQRAVVPSVQPHWGPCILAVTADLCSNTYFRFGGRLVAWPRGVNGAGAVLKPHPDL